MELQWKANANLSAMHTAWCIAQFPEYVHQCDERLRLAGLTLDGLSEQFRVPKQRFWEQLLTLAPTVDFSGDLAERLMVRVGLASDTQRSLLASALKDARRLFDAAYPKYVQEVPLRAGPLRSLWEAQGPGILHFIRRLTQEDLIVGHAEVVLVQPIVGGIGYAHLQTNRIHLEGLLTNADPELPETLRVAWLLAQLDFERPVYSEMINAFRLRPVAGLSLLPAVLQAGEELELCRYAPELLEKAIQLWHVDTFGLAPNVAAQVVSTWWETYQVSRPEWRIALTGIDRMLQA
jgi:hypothetical protein